MLVLAPVVLGVLTGGLTAAVDAFVSRKAAVWTAVAGLVASGGVAIWDMLNVPATTAYEVFMGGSGFSFIAGLILLLAAAAVAGGSAWFSEHSGGGLAASLVALSAAAAVTLACSADLLMTLIALETVAICSYAMVAQSRTASSSEASMKYLIQGSLTAALMIVGIGMVLAVAGGVTGLNQLQGRLMLGAAGAGAPVLAGAMGLIVAALAFKLSAFPFHSWAPDAFESAPPASAGFMSGAVKVGAVFSAYALTLGLFTGLPQWRLAGTVFGRAYELTDARASVLWAALATGSIVFGNLGALKQTSFGRMLGYSGIAQIGYVLVGLAAGAQTVPAGMVLVSAYAIAVLAAFLVAEAVRAARPGWDGSIAGMAGFGREHPLMGASLAVALFSLTGIPLTAGFWGKVVVFGNALIAGDEWLVVLGLLGSVVSFGYYGRALRSAYFDETVKPNPDIMADPCDLLTEEGTGETRPGRVPIASTIVTVALAVVVLIVGVAPLFFGLTFFATFFTFGG